MESPILETKPFPKPHLSLLIVKPFVFYEFLNPVFYTIHF
jgi:hypothetical protein